MTKKTNPFLQLIVIFYPIAMFGIGASLNYFMFDVTAMMPATPTRENLIALTIAAMLLILNHSWLMISTELTRDRFKMHASPEEWAKSGDAPEDVSKEGRDEVGRRYKAHRNTTENVVYFVFAALIFVFVSPPSIAVFIWTVGFALARIGYTAAYLAGSDGMRGLFMSLGLVCLFGIASYLMMSVFV